MEPPQSWPNWGSVLASFMFIAAFAKDFLPFSPGSLIKRISHKLFDFLYPYAEIRIDEQSRDWLRSSSKVFDLVSIYLAANSSKSARKLRANLDKDSENLNLSMDVYQEITDEFSGVTVWWSSHTSSSRPSPFPFYSETEERSFYASEVLLALEYLHMMGVVYRDLKPENVLVREDGHIMLSDFDLSLKCYVSPTLVKSSIGPESSRKISTYFIEPSCTVTACVQPTCLQPSCFAPHLFSSKKSRKSKHEGSCLSQATGLPELIAEPTSARSMSFVGTHEYLAPEIIKGEGHGSAVDWWTFGIFLYELLHGRTPFKGLGNRATLFNVVGQPLKFPDAPPVSFAAKDLIKGLLVKDPQHLLAYKRGATEIKQHPFFESVNWALVRSTSPPEVPMPVDPTFVTNANVPPKARVEREFTDSEKSSGSYLDFEFF